MCITSSRRADVLPSMATTVFECRSPRASEIPQPSPVFPGFCFCVLTLRFTSCRRVQSLYHPSRPMAAYGFDLVEQGVGWAEMATERARSCRAPSEISERLRPIGGRRGSAGARESERLERGLVGGGREAEGAGWAASAAAICARAATIWMRSSAAMIGVGSVSF
jgi:hypothetical protein